jgi:hypothetical protein
LLVVEDSAKRYSTGLTTVDGCSLRYDNSAHS